DRARGEGVVDAVGDVAERSVLGEDQLVDERAAVAGRAQLDLVAGVGLELRYEVLGDVERVVRDHAHGLACGGGAARLRPAAGQRAPGQGGGRGDGEGRDEARDAPGVAAHVL